MPLAVGVRGAQEHLAAHAEVRQQRLPAVELEPAELATPDDVRDDGAAKPGREVLGPGLVPADGARVKDLDVAEPGAGHPAGEAAAHHLDLGQLGHASGPEGRSAAEGAVEGAVGSTEPSTARQRRSRAAP